MCSLSNGSKLSLSAMFFVGDEEQVFRFVLTWFTGVAASKLLSPNETKGVAVLLQVGIIYTHMHMRMRMQNSHNAHRRPRMHHCIAEAFKTPLTFCTGYKYWKTQENDQTDTKELSESSCTGREDKQLSKGLMII